MTTLHRVAEVTKKLIVFFIFGLIGIIAIVLSIQAFQNAHPAPPPPPNVAFGKLPNISFPKSQVNGTFTYNLNTVTGTLPTFENQTKVYKIIQPQPNLLAFDKIQQIVQKNNFLGKPVEFSQTQYQWSNDSPPFAVLTYDTLTQNFKIRSNYPTDPNVLSTTNLPDQQGAIQTAQDFFGSFSSFPSDIDLSKTQTNLYTLTNGQLTTASSLSNTQIIGVDFFQKDVDKMPIYYPYYPHSTIRALVASGDSAPQVVEADFIHNTIDLTQSATYPLKTAKQAFEELQQGKGYIANYNGSGTDVNILSVSLGYYVGDNQNQFLMPIIVFQGDNNFYAYVNAITNEWINN